MANDLVPYSQALSDPASTASSLETTDVMAMAREDADKPTGFKSMVFRLLTLAKKIVSGIDYSTELTETSNKTITGAINEVASMAANVDITTLLDTPAPIQTFSDGGDNIPMKSCEVAIVAQQASGTPSPSNPLPITGFSSVALSVSDGSTPTTTNVSLGQTIYGGTAEIVGGNGTKTWESLTNLANGDWSSQGEGDYQFFALSVSGADTTRLAELLCNKYRTFTPGLTNTDDNIVGIISSGTVLRIRDKRFNATTINDFKTSLSDCVVIFPKATPTAFTFTGANIPTLSGTNNVYADSGDVNALEYFNDKADDIASMVRLMTRT